MEASVVRRGEPLERRKVSGVARMAPVRMEEALAVATKAVESASAGMVGVEEAEEETVVVAVVAVVAEVIWAVVAVPSALVLEPAEGALVAEVMEVAVEEAVAAMAG